MIYVKCRWYLHSTLMKSEHIKWVIFIQEPRITPLDLLGWLVQEHNQKDIYLSLSICIYLKEQSASSAAFQSVKQIHMNVFFFWRHIIMYPIHQNELFWVAYICQINKIWSYIHIYVCVCVYIYISISIFIYIYIYLTCWTNPTWGQN